MSRTDLTEKQWRQLSPYLPPSPHHGHAYVEHRYVINGIFLAFKDGCALARHSTSLRSLADRLRPLVRWSRNGTSQRLLKIMQAAADEADSIDWDGAALDVTHVKAHRSASRAWKEMLGAEKRGAVTDEWLGRSRGGNISKIHLCVDGHGLPLSIVVTAGQCSDAAQIGPVLDAICVPRPGRGRPRKRLSFLCVDCA